MSRDSEEAAALLRRAEELDDLGRHVEEIVVYDEVIRRFAGSDDLAVVGDVLHARLDKAITLYDLDREPEALAMLQDLRSRCEPGGEGAHERFDWVLARVIKYQAFALQALDRDDEALAHYDEVAARFGHSTDPVVLADVARSLRQKASLLWYLDRQDEALETEGQVVRRFDGVDDAELREQVALASADRGHWLSWLERWAEALEAYDLARRCDDLGYDALVKLLYGRACALNALDRGDEAIAQFAGVVVLFSADEDLEVRAYAAQAGNWHGALLGENGQRDDAIAAHRQVAEFSTGTDHPRLRQEHARALLNVAACLADEGRTDEAITTYDELLVAYSDDEKLARDIDHALRGKLALLARCNRTAETIVLAAALSERMAAKAVEPGQVEAALSAKGTALAAEGRFGEAAEAFEEAAAAAADSDDHRLRATAGLALFNKCAALGALGRLDEAMALQDEMTHRFGADMLAVVDEWVGKLGADQTPSTRLRRAQLLLLHAHLLNAFDRGSDAMHLLDQILGETVEDNNPAISQLRSVAGTLREQLVNDD